MNLLEYYKESLVSNNWSPVELELDLNEFDRQLQRMILSVAYIYKVLCYLPPVSNNWSLVGLELNLKQIS